MDIAFEDKARALRYSRACGQRGWNLAAALDRIPTQFHGLASAAYYEGKRWHKPRFNLLLADRVRRFVAKLVRAS